MLDVTICIGSSCHLKGSYEVLERLQALIDRRKLNDALGLKASFCMGNCRHSVCVSIGEEKFGDINKSNVDDFFRDQVLPRL